MGSSTPARGAPKRLPATEARVRFGALVRSIAAGEGPIVVERDGRPEMVAVAVAQHERLAAAADPLAAWLDRVDRLRERILGELGGQALPPAQDLVGGGRDERDDDLAGLR